MLPISSQAAEATVKDVENQSKPDENQTNPHATTQPLATPATPPTSNTPPDAVPDEEESAVVVAATWSELIKHWFILGWTAFGGPAAHIGMFQKLFVDRLRWCTYLVFTELLMLGQCIPGPTSTQMGFSLGVLKKGLAGGLVSGVLFQGPGLLILSVLGWAAARVLDDDIQWLNGLVAGLAAAGIALVASAAVSLTKNICKTRLLEVIATAAAVIAYYYPKPWTFPAVIVAGGLLTIVLKRKEVVKTSDLAAGVDSLGFGKFGGTVLILAWVGVLIGTVVAAGKSEYYSNVELHWFAAFFRTGSVIFGGGQVVLPMLYENWGSLYLTPFHIFSLPSQLLANVVGTGATSTYNDVVAADCQNQTFRCCPADGVVVSDDIIAACSSNNADANPSCKCSWISGNEFYAGLALAQAMPGPLFNFAAYLGAVIALNAGVFAIAGIALCWVGLFAPGILLIFAILPFWGTFRKFQIYKRALPGLNSAAIGLIISSVFQLTLNAYGTSPFPKTSICIGILAFSATDVLKVPAPLVVIAGGGLGVVGWAADMV